jgi:hypothetical protein
MQTLKELWMQLLEKSGYSTTANPDSVMSRTMATRKAHSEDDEEDNKIQANGATIAKKMGFEDDRSISSDDARPRSVMDDIFTSWNKGKKKKDVK